MEEVLVQLPGLLLGMLLLGWGLVWWVLADRLSGVHSYLDAVYFAGVGFFTVGFGDVVPVVDRADRGLVRRRRAGRPGRGVRRLGAVVRRGLRQPHRLPDAAFFRSRQPGQHWLTALGMVTDAASICLAAIRAPGRGRLRAGYLPYLRATIAVLLVPPEFRNHATPLPLEDQERAR
jgi:hypothetical protein